MKSNKILLPTISFVMVAGILATSSGCRSASSWSPTGWLASRQPDAEKLAGRNGAPEFPTSPSLNHTPSALASKAAQSPNSQAPNADASSLATGGTTFQGSPVGASGANPIAAGGQVPPGTGGLAARANGYQTGPYGMSSTPYPSASLPTAASTDLPTRTASASSPSSPSGALSTGIPATDSASFPNPYGGSFTGFNTPKAGSPGENLPSSAPVAPSTTASTGSGLPSYPSLTGASQASSSSTNYGGGFTAPQSQYPPLPSFNTQSAAPTSNPAAGEGAASAGSAGNNPYTGSSSGTPPASAYQSSIPTGNFAPGTTGRTTSYNFGLSDGGTSLPSSTPSSSGLPPNTATGESPLLR